MGGTRPSKAEIWTEAQRDILEMTARRFVKPGENPENNVFIKLVGHVTGRKPFSPALPKFVQRAQAKGVDLFIGQSGGIMNNKAKNTAAILKDPTVQKLLQEAGDGGITSRRESKPSQDEPPQRLEPITQDDLINTDFLTFMGKKIKEG
nr:hypothetical protein BdHM001_35770 [Bdellovibrio sp. HM001]